MYSLGVLGCNVKVAVNGGVYQLNLQIPLMKQKVAGSLSCLSFLSTANVQ